MARHCPSCGQELRESDKFCSECGTSVAGAAPPAQLEPWEYCEITWTKKRFRRRKAYFWARDRETRAEIVRGKKTFELSSNLHNEPDVDENKFTAAALDDVVQRLLRAGWEPAAASGRWWFSQRFRRPVKS